MLTRVVIGNCRLLKDLVNLCIVCYSFNVQDERTSRGAMMRQTTPALYKGNLVLLGLLGSSIFQAQ
jgi:hypothetical protein